MKRQKRPYDNSKRAVASEETRKSITDAARELMAGVSYFDISLEDIANQAGVSRQTIYFQFKSKRNVLLALADGLGTAWLDNFPAELPLSELRPALKRLAALYRREADLLRNLYAQAVYDAEFAAALRGQAERQRDYLKTLVAAWPLSPGWTTDAAADWLYATTGFGLYETLVLERGWPDTQYIEYVLGALPFG
jgi:AcrR family transcriptional regulator